MPWPEGCRHSTRSIGMPLVLAHFVKVERIKAKDDRGDSWERERDEIAV